MCGSMCCRTVNNGVQMQQSTGAPLYNAPAQPQHVCPIKDLSIPINCPSYMMSACGTKAKTKRPRWYDHAVLTSLAVHCMPISTVPRSNPLYPADASVPCAAWRHITTQHARGQPTVTVVLAGVQQQAPALELISLLLSGPVPWL